MRARRGVGIVLLLLIGGTAPLWGPLSLRRVSRFAVQRVEIAGTRMLAPHQVLAASGIRSGQNVWDDADPWEAALRKHPVIADASVTRRLPGTLTIRVLEREPAGLVDDAVLVPVASDGTVLPLDPALSPVDLPVIRTRGLAKPAARALLAESGRVSQMDPALWARVSEVHHAPRRGLVLRIAEPQAEAILPTGADQRRIRQLRSTLEHLAAQEQPDSGVHVRLDLRWKDQIVLARSSR